MTVFGHSRATTLIGSTFSPPNSSSAPSFERLAGVRPLALVDHELLVSFASGPRTLDYVAFFPEAAFEARLIHGEAARLLVLTEVVAPQNRHLRYLYKSVNPMRARRHVVRMQNCYAGNCQISLMTFDSLSIIPLLSRGFTFICHREPTVLPSVDTAYRLPGRVVYAAR